MILGIFETGRPQSALKQELLQRIDQAYPAAHENQHKVWASQHIAFSWLPTQIDTLDEFDQPFLSKDGAIVVIFEGKIYNLAEIKRHLGPDYPFRTNHSGEALAHLYAKSQDHKYPDRYLDQVNGKFAFALWDCKRQRLVLGRDRLGIQPLFYAHHGHRVVFSSSLKTLLATGWIDRQLNPAAILEYLLYCYNPGQETILKTVYKLPAGHLLSINSAGVSLKQYWQLSFATVPDKTETQYCQEIPALIKDAVRLRMEPTQMPAVLLSGGIDSSSMVSLTSSLSTEPLSTFSFRCAGRSYDESYYARLVANRYGTRHTEISYQPTDLSLISQAVEAMDEPFCDIGIEIGTFLLGRAAQGKASYVFSGEGGDELFAGHPVYTADKVAAFIDRFPTGLLAPITTLLQRIPDSDQKKNVQVKLKRFAYSLSFPPALLSHRWRIYYKPAELMDLCTPEFLTTCNLDHLYDSMLVHTQAADGQDELSRSLYSDYQTLVSFYLRRLELLRPFGIENRLPLLDHRLVEYAAQIPSDLKLRGFSDTKYIYKQALVGILPDEILFKRPKLGHSVPMKNWMREDGTVQQWMLEILSDRSFLNRGFFEPSQIEAMINQHLNKSHNYSHRLWALVVLELWLRACWDN